MGWIFQNGLFFLIIWSTILSVDTPALRSIFVSVTQCTAAFWRGSMTHGLARSLGPPIFSNVLRSRLKTPQKTWYFYRTETRACVVGVMAFLINFPRNKRINFRVLTNGIFMQLNVGYDSLVTRIDRKWGHAW